ncbi:GP63 - leishmanolysin [Leishmania donovani]|uniref:Leishmanolysin n=1 Tax=Leishmania donovani TaxID=5661 RepID=A0A6J8F8Y0_LEIDO|nr:GP63 - leishmanolysin [Leishmania donovani]VDZ42620.1 GP63_leishmanolysin/GeneDB:LmjF.10.0460/GeneDB:LmjF.10.0465/GeneDB:LmjF.10.0470/GeneDB:LmjF.10.0480 [Leishmania donovani]
MSVDSSSTHRHRSVAARLVRLAAAGAAVIAAVGTAAAWAHAGAVQHRCIHDAMQARVRQSVARHHTAPGAVSAVGLSYVTLGAAPTVVRAANWGALRIAVSTEDLTDPAYHCARVGQRISTRDGRFAICTAEDILTDEKRDILVKYLIPQALQLHTERLKVRQVQDKWKVTGMGNEICGHFKVPPAHITDGLSNTDFVMYVASVPSEEDVLAWATTCQVFSDGHPAVGVINIPAANIASRYDQLVTRVVTHEMAHALGFSVVFFRDARILESFERSAQGLRCSRDQQQHGGGEGARAVRLRHLGVSGDGGPGRCRLRRVAHQDAQRAGRAHGACLGCGVLQRPDHGHLPGPRLLPGGLQQGRGDAVGPERRLRLPQREVHGAEHHEVAGDVLQQR